MALTDNWRFEMTKEADKALNHLDKPVKQRIISYFENRVLKSENPRQLGKPLNGKLKPLWSYRIGNYRVITDIQDDRLVILAVNIEHRREVYERI